VILVILAITMFGGHVRLINTVSKVRAKEWGYTEGRHYPYVLGGRGTLLQSKSGIGLARLLVNAGPGENVKRGADHHNLTIGALRVYASPNPRRTQQGREDAIKEALRLHNKATAEAVTNGGQTPVLSASDYESMVRLDLTARC
jgi:hypothetical protein